MFNELRSLKSVPNSRIHCINGLTDQAKLKLIEPRSLLDRSRRAERHSGDPSASKSVKYSEIHRNSTEMPIFYGFFGVKFLEGHFSDLVLQLGTEVELSS